MNEPIKNILIAGVGGQGTLLTSRIIANVAVNMGWDVKISEVHGMAQRGGSVVSQVRYGEKVYSPIIDKKQGDILLAFEKLEAARWLDYLKPNGLLLVNDDRIDPLPVMSGKAKYPTDIIDKVRTIMPDTVLLNATKIAVDCGNVKAANVVLVGALAAAIGLPEDKVEKAIEQLVPAHVLEINLMAFNEGQKAYKINSHLKSSLSQ